MRKLLAMTGLIVAAALGWTAWWFFIATAKERAIEAWLTERRAAGWVAEAEGVGIGGFPYRVVTNVRGLELANPQGGWAWSAPTFQFLTLAYQPNHLIAFWPPEQTFSTPFGAATITSELMEGSLVVEPNSRIGLRRAAINLREVGVLGALGWRATVREGVLRRAPDPGPGGAGHPERL